MSGGISGATAPIMPISASSFFLDRRMGRSTPDSEALASSDDEHDPSHMTTSMISNISTRSNPAANGASSSSTLPRPTRRPSWLSEIQPNYPRQGSRPQTSASVAVDNGTPSPTTAGASSSFPFTIPLQPTLKPHRSASYSVGQLDANLSSSSDNHQPSYTNNNHVSAQAMAPFIPAAASARNTRPANALTRRASRLPALPDLTEDSHDTTAPDSPHHLSGFTSNEMESAQLTPTLSGYPALRNSTSNTGLRRQVTLENANRRHRDSMTGGASGAMNQAMNPQLRAVSQIVANEQSSSGYTDYGDSFRTPYGAQGARRFSENAAFSYNMPNSARDHWATSSVTESVDDINSEQDIHREINRIVANEMPGRTMSMSSHRPGTSHSAQIDYDNLPAALARSATLQDHASSAVYDDEDDPAMHPLTRSATHSAAFSNQDMRRNLRSASFADISASGGGFNQPSNEFPSPRAEMHSTAAGTHAGEYNHFRRDSVHTSSPKSEDVANVAISRRESAPPAPRLPVATLARAAAANGGKYHAYCEDEEEVDQDPTMQYEGRADVAASRRESAPPAPRLQAAIPAMTTGTNAGMYEPAYDNVGHESALQYDGNLEARGRGSAQCPEFTPQMFELYLKALDPYAGEPRSREEIFQEYRQHLDNLPDVTADDRGFVPYQDEFSQPPAMMFNTTIHPYAGWQQPSYHDQGRAFAQQYQQHYPGRHQCCDHDDGHAFSQQYERIANAAAGVSGFVPQQDHGPPPPAHYAIFARYVAAQPSYYDPAQQYRLEYERLFDNCFAENYFSGVGPYARGISNRGPDAVPPNPYRPRMPEPRRVLCIVQFKLARVEIYYFYDTMHLELKVGDLVIVEGDRGHDLGTLAHIDVSPEDAVKFRKEYANRHYQYLLMFSEHQRTTTTLANAPPFAPVSAAANASRQGPQSSQPVLSQRDSVNPKQIRRKAESHEIGLLREKERNETKAKRLCQTKANEMGLNMEVLDAEFQIDFQKLTFFYYAPSYVNFGNLVTDLFKVYKARIWMSAVNPESFQQNPNVINDASGFGIAVGAVQRRGPPAGQRSRTQPGLGGLSNPYVAAPTTSAPAAYAPGYGAPSPTYAGQNGAQQFNDWQGFYAPPGYQMYQPQAYEGYAGYDPSVWRQDRA